MQPATSTYIQPVRISHLLSRCCFATFAALNSTLVTQLLRIKRSERHRAARPTAQYAAFLANFFTPAATFTHTSECWRILLLQSFVTKCHFRCALPLKVSRGTQAEIEERVTKKMKPKCLTVASGMNLKNESVL
jgi:hypothetical protein